MSNEIQEKSLKMTAAEAGRKGGKAVFNKYGKQHFANLGHKSGSKLRDERGVEFFRKMAEVGGATTAVRYSHEHFSNLGRQGGEKLKEERGAEYYRSISLLAAAARKRNQEVRKAQLQRSD